MFNESQSVLVLPAHNKPGESLRAYFGRRFPIWEGHTRDELDMMVERTKNADGSPVALCSALVAFMGAISTGFSASNFGDRLVSEVETGCSKPTRGKPAALQRVGREILDRPNHVGVAAALRVIRDDPAFEKVLVNYPREFCDATRLGEFADPDEGMAELAHRRSFARVPVPSRAASTVHKAKGLECENVLVLPCDDQHFKDNEKDRCVFYVAISRARRSLTLVVPRENPSPLLIVD